MEYTTADDILAKCSSAVSLLDSNSMIQVSMDQPKTDLKFHKLLKSYQMKNEQPYLIDIAGFILDLFWA